jgi:DNA polymerase I-like protein with 3'-5' exonuclease and polymerase domains
MHGNFKWEKRTRTDWEKISVEMLSRPLRRPSREFIIEPTDNELRELFEQVAIASGPVAIDIETWGRTLSCVGFAVSPSKAYVLPTSTKQEREHYLPYIKALSESPNHKILQNGLFDLYWLAAYRVHVKSYMWDTLAMHHCVDPAEDHDLAFLSSIYSPHHVYWKDEAKDAEEVMKYASSRDAVLTYNAMDCVATYEVFCALYRELQRTGMLPFYERHYQAMFMPLLELMRRGIRCDVKKQKEWAKRLEGECDVVRKSLKKLAGEELYATKDETLWRVPTKPELTRLLVDPAGGQEPKNIDRVEAKAVGYVMSKKLVRDKKKILLKDFSGKKLQRFFYDTLAVPKQYKITHVEGGKEWRETLDKTALLKIVLRHKKAKEPARLLLEHRRKTKVAMFLKASKDRDGRIRCAYKHNTEAGRLASAKNPMGGGFNLQNQDREIRDTYLPEKGQVWIGFDGSQVEDRVCKMLTGAKRMQDLANLRPGEFDAHQWMAERIGTTRYNAKRVTHAAQRGMRGKKLQEVFLREDEIIIEVKECDRMLDAYLGELYEIRDFYFPWVRELLWTNNKRLANSWGRTIDFGTERLDDDLYRRAYSWPLQSECVDWLNQWGFLPTRYYLRDKKSKLLTQEHDGFGVSTEPEEAWDLCQHVVRNLERPRQLRGGSLVIPVTITVGRSWAGEEDGGVEFKRLPERDELEEAIRRVKDG